jgi:hypothetical protein
MLFMVTYKLRPEHRTSAVTRFLETGGPPPEGVKMVGRWHDASMRRGFVLSDSPDAEAAAKWCHQWADLLTFEVIPVLDDDQVLRVFKT